MTAKQPRSEAMSYYGSYEKEHQDQIRYLKLKEQKKKQEEKAGTTQKTNEKEKDDIDKAIFNEIIKKEMERYRTEGREGV